MEWFSQATAAVGVQFSSQTLVMITTDGSDSCLPNETYCGLFSPDLASLMLEVFEVSEAMSMDQVHTVLCYAVLCCAVVFIYADRLAVYITFRPLLLIPITTILETSPLHIFYTVCATRSCHANTYVCMHATHRADPRQCGLTARTLSAMGWCLVATTRNPRPMKARVLWPMGCSLKSSCSIAHSCTTKVLGTS